MLLPLLDTYEDSTCLSYLGYIFPCCLERARSKQLPSTPRFMSALGAIDTLLGIYCGRARPGTRGAHIDLSSSAER